jgi:putative transposase
VSRKGTRLIAAFRVVVQRPQQAGVTSQGSAVGVDVGVRVLATVASADGTVLDRVPNPRPLEAALKELRHLCRERSRRTRGSRRYAATQKKIARLQRRAADIRACRIHRLTTRLAKTHGAIVAEGLDAAGMLRQKGLAGARAPDGAACRTQPSARPAASWPTRPAGTAPASSWPTGSTRRRRPAVPAGTRRTSGEPSAGPADSAGSAISGTTTPLSTSRATSRPPRVIAPSAQSGPPSSAEPAVRPGPARQAAMKRGRDAAARLPNNPETGCQRDEHYHSLTGNGSGRHWSR